MNGGFCGSRHFVVLSLNITNREEAIEEIMIISDRRLLLDPPSYLSSYLLLNGYSFNSTFILLSFVCEFDGL